MNIHQIRAINKEDRSWINPLLTEHWGSPVMVTRGRIYRADELPGFIAIHDGKPVGLITYCIDGNSCEIVSMNSLEEGRGIGTALMDAVKNAAVAAGCRRLWLITTNDNIHALRFWQKRGFTLAAVYPDAIAQSRQIKPEIPLTGNDGIPIRDEIELEMVFG